MIPVFPWILFHLLNSSNFETFTAMILKLQEDPIFVMFFQVMQTIHFIYVCVR